MDVIALAQAGFENVVAPMGTALTENQLELIWRMSGEPVLCFDGDQAGLKAAWRAADMALPLIQPGRTLRFALLPEGKDPDDLVKADGPDAFRAVLDEARPLADLLWMRETSGGVFDTPERRADLEKTLRELAARIRDESVRYHYQQEMRERVHAFFGAQRSRPCRQGQVSAGRQAQWPGAGRPVGEGRRGGRTPRRFGKPRPARRWSSAPAASCRCAKRRSSWRWSTIRADRREFRPVECLDLGHPELQGAAPRADRRAWRMSRPAIAARRSRRSAAAGLRRRLGARGRADPPGAACGRRWRRRRWTMPATLSPRRCTCSAAPARYIRS